MGHVPLRTEASPHLGRPRRGAHRTGASAPLGDAWEALGKRQKAIARGAVSFPMFDKRTLVPDCLPILV